MTKSRPQPWPKYRCRRCNMIFVASAEMREKFDDAKVRRRLPHRLRCQPCDEAILPRITNKAGPPNRADSGTTSPGAMWAGDRIKCQAGGMHWWGLWGSISDPINIDDGSTGGFVYMRECSAEGCGARQKVKELEPTQAPVTYRAYSNALIAYAEGE